MNRYYFQSKQWVETNLRDYAVAMAGFTIVALSAIAYATLSKDTSPSDTEAEAQLLEITSVNDFSSTLKAIDVQSHADHARSQRNQALTSTIEQIDRDLRSIALETHADVFASEMVTWTSKFQLVGGSDSHRQWAKQRFYESVLDPGDLRSIIHLRAQQLQNQLITIDDRFFVALKADVDAVRTSFSTDSIDLEGIDNLILVMVETAEQAVWVSVAELVYATGVSGVTGNAATAMLSDAGDHDEYGNPTVGNQIGSFLGGLIVGLATDVAISEVVDTEGRLEEAVLSSVATGLEQLYIGQPGSRNWMSPLEAMVVEHEAACLQAIEASQINR